MPAYRQNWPERLGWYKFSLKQCIWLHAVSLGEVNAALPLIKALQSIYPQVPLLVTTTTPTGKARVKTMLGETVFHAYLPFDLSLAMRRFLSRMDPQIGLIMETELWPNLLHLCHQQQIPICLLNARLSSQSANGYRRILPIANTMLNQLDYIAAQSAEDAARFVSLGAKQDKVIVTGNIKFDLTPPPGLEEACKNLRKQLGENRFVWIAASTHEGEEEKILSAHQQLRKHHPDALLILVPRHPDRFEGVAKITQRLFPMNSHSGKFNQVPVAEMAVYLGDAIGQLLLLYGAADAAFVGGSLVEIGGHNLLEPALLSKPVLTGPYLHNFTEIKNLFLAANAVFIINTIDELVNKLLLLSNDGVLRKSMAESGFSIIKAGRGALDKKISIIQSLINKNINNKNK